MPKGRVNRSGVDWSNPAAVAKYKRENENHREYNRQYMQEKHPPTGNPPGQRGETHGMAKLSWRVVRWMRARYARGGISYAGLRAVLARAGYAVTSGTIAAVIRGEQWKERECAD